MDYTPHTQEDVRAMLDVIGVSGTDRLFEQIPDGVRLHRPLRLPPPMTESEVFALAEEIASANTATDRLRCFAGGGAYDHYVPAVVRALAYRGEFATSYTPYQPELAQGVLGALFEFQTMMCELTGMEVSNASLYDGASALVEAANLAASVTGRRRIMVSEAVNPNYRRVLETFAAGPGYDIETAGAALGVTETPDLTEAACLIVAQPNFLGTLEDIAAISRKVHEAGALLIVHFDPLAAGILEAPGRLGADVVTGEGQSLGNELAFGGPYLGLFATKQQHVRRVPGRIVGATVDADGKPAFVLTLQAREQHIRREKANSNVCTNQTLMAIAATIYLAWLGPGGLEELGDTCARRGRYAADLLASVPGCSLAHEAPFFKEFVLRVPGDASEVVAGAAARGFLIGPALGDLYDGRQDQLLVAVTERRSVEEIESLAKCLAEVVA